MGDADTEHLRCSASHSQRIVRKPVETYQDHVSICLCAPPPTPDNLEYAEGTKEGQSIPKWPGSGTEMDMSHHSLDKTLVNRHISAQIFIHVTQLKIALQFT